MAEKYSNVVSITYEGNIIAAQRLTGQARKCMGLLLEAMAFGGLKTLERDFKDNSGNIIRCYSNQIGLAPINQMVIFSPNVVKNTDLPKPLESVEPETDVITGFIVNVFCETQTDYNNIQDFDYYVFQPNYEKQKKPYYTYEKRALRNVVHGYPDRYVGTNNSQYTDVPVPSQIEGLQEDSNEHDPSSNYQMFSVFYGDGIDKTVAVPKKGVATTIKNPAFPPTGGSYDSLSYWSWGYSAVHAANHGTGTTDLIPYYTGSFIGDFKADPPGVPDYLTAVGLTTTAMENARLANRAAAIQAYDVSPIDKLNQAQLDANYQLWLTTKSMGGSYSFYPAPSFSIRNANNNLSFSGLFLNLTGDGIVIEKPSKHYADSFIIVSGREDSFSVDSVFNLNQVGIYSDSLSHSPSNVGSFRYLGVNDLLLTRGTTGELTEPFSSFTPHYEDIATQCTATNSVITYTNTYKVDYLAFKATSKVIPGDYVIQPTLECGVEITIFGSKKLSKLSYKKEDLIGRQIVITTLIDSPLDYPLVRVIKKAEKFL